MNRLKSLLDSFLENFFTNASYVNTHVFKDNLLVKLPVSVEQFGAVNMFAYEIGNHIFIKNKFGSNLTNNLKKTSDFFKQYCNFVRLIKFKGNFTQPSYKIYEDLYKETIRLQELYKQVYDEFNRNKKADIKIHSTRANNVLTTFVDFKNQLIMNQVKNQIKVNRIKLKVLETPESIIYDIKTKCNEAEQNTKNSYSMLVSSGLNDAGYYVPMIKMDKIILRSILKELKNKQKKIETNQILTDCKHNKYVQLFSSLEKHANDNTATIIDSDTQYSYQKIHSSCMSFSNFHSIPIKYPWFEKDLYVLNVSLDTKNPLYSSYRNFLLDKCIIAKNVIVGSGMKIYLENNVIQEFNVTINETKSALWIENTKLEANETNGQGIYIYEPNFLIVLGYELTNLCGLNATNYSEEIYAEYFIN